MPHKFNLVITEDPDVGGYTMECPQMPGCVTEADTLEELYRNWAEASSLWLQAAREDTAAGRASARSGELRRPCRNAGCRKVRKGLDPSFYGDLATFRAAVAAGTVDASKGCRNMAEYRQSLDRAHV